MSLYDVFLSHASADKPAVEHLAHKLREAGIEPFLDKWHLIPGQPWQEALEEALDQSRTCAVFLGKTLGPWQNEEMRTALDEQVRTRSYRVIPVLLPGGKQPVDRNLPRFLRRRTWVDFRAGVDDEAAFHLLLAGIQGKAPGPGGGAEKPSLPYRCMAPAREPFVQRSEYEKVRDALLADGSDRGTTVGITTAIHGAGGFGKTALAIELCYDAQVRAQYPDGILWTTMGEEIDAASRLARVRDLIRWWSDEEPPAFETVSAASAHLREELDGKRVLLVVDDVWRPEDVTPFQGLGPRDALLVTTRDSRTLPADSVPIHVDAMEVPEAVRLLGAGLPAGAEAELKTLAALLGEWPLLLKIVNRQVASWISKGLDLREAIHRAENALKARGLTYFDPKDAKERSQASALTLEVSLERLSPEEQNRFTELAIFPEDTNVPLIVLEKLWQLDPLDVEELASRLFDLSLLRDFDLRSGAIRLHDVIRAYLLKKGESHLPEWHRRLLDACLPASGRWPDLPRDESYLWNHLIHHLIGAGQSGVCQVLLLDFHYLRSKLSATDVNALLADYSAFTEKDEALRLVRDALRLSAHVLARNPAELREQLWGRLLGRQEAGIRGLLNESEGFGTPWLRPRIASLPRPGGALIRTIEHPEVPNALAVLYEGQVVSGSADGRLRMWNVESGTVLKVFEGHFISVLALGVLDNRRVVSSSADGRLGVWDVESGKLLQVLEGHSNLVFTVAVLDSHRVVSGSADGTLRVWDIESGQTLQTLKGHSGGVHAVAVLDSHRVVSGSADRTLRVWDVESGQALQVLQGHSDRVSAVASFNGRVVSASGPFDGTLRVWDLKSGQTLHIIEGHSGGAHALAALGGHRVISGSADGTLRVWDVESGQTLQVLEGHSDKVHSVAPLDSRRMVSGAADGTLRVWDVESGQALQLLEGSSRRINSISVLDSHCVVSGSDDRRLRVWDVENGRALQVLEERSSPVTAVAVFGSHRMVSGSEDGTLRVWDLESGQALRRLDGHSRRVNAIAVLDSHRVVSGSSDRTLRVWDVASGQALQVLESHSNRVYTVAVLDSRRVVSGSVDGTLWVWDVESDRVLQVLRGHLGGVNTVAVLDGRRVVSGSADGNLREWDVESGRTLQILPGRSGPVYAVAALDSRRVVFGSFDRTLRVWDLESGEVECLFRLDAPVSAVAVIAESCAIIAGDGSGCVHFFDYVEKCVSATSSSGSGGGGARETGHRAENAPEAKGFTYFDPESAKERSQAADLTPEISLERLSKEEQERFAGLAIFPEDAAVPLSVLEKLWHLDSLEVEALSSRLYELSLLRDFDRQGGKIRVPEIIRAYLLKTWELEIPKFHRLLLDACRPLNGRWWNLPREEQYLWWNLAHHLIGAGEGESLRSLLFDFEYVQSKLQATDAFALVADYWALEADEELKVMQSALALFAYDLAQNKSQLAPQLLGRLLYRQESGIQHLLRGARRGAFWFRPKTPPSESSHHGITALAALSRRRVVSGSSDGVIRVWDTEEGEILQTLEGHTGRVNGLAVLDGCRVLSCSDDGTIRLWGAESGRALRILEGHTNRVRALTVLEDHLVAFSSNDATLRLWNMETGETHILEGHTGEIIALAALEGRRFVSGSDDATIRLWDVDRGGTLRTLRGHMGKIRALAALDSHRIASGSDDGTVRLWNAESGEALCTMKGHFDSVRALSVLRHQLIASGSDDGTVRLWNVESGETLRCLEGCGWVRNLWALDERRIVASSQDGGIRLWNVESGLCLAFLNLGTAHPATAAFVPESETLVIGDMAGRVQFLGIEPPKL